MIDQSILIASLLLQAAATAVALMLLKVTGRRKTFLLIAGALSMMIVRRLIAFIDLSPSAPLSPAARQAELIALLISALWLAGLYGILAMYRDVAEARSALQRSEERYRSLFSHMFNGMALFETVFDDKGRAIDARYLETNLAFEKHTGLHRDAVIGRTLTEVLPGVESDWIKDINETATTGAEKEFERAANSLGRTYHVTLFSPRKNQAACLFYDATERIRLSREISKFKMICDWANYGMSIVDLQGTALYVNRCLADILGYRIEDLVGRPFAGFIPAERQAECMKLFAGVLEHGHVDNSEMECLHRDGSSIPFLHNATLIRGDQGEPLFVAATSIDLREIKTLEMQLRQSQKMESIGLLAGGIAHDFNNLLMVILGYAEMAGEEIAPGHPAASMLREILVAGERGSRLVRQLLAFGRRQKLSLEIMSLNAVIRETQAILKRMVGESVELEYQFEADLGNVRADAVQIQQILMNLAANGRDAMPAGGRLTIATSNVELSAEQVRKHHPLQPGGYIVLSVTDNGAGIEPAYRERIFEPFFTTKESGKGTGLGLATVHGIVLQLGGDVTVDSEPGFGTTFRIYLPRVSESALAQSQEAEASIELKGDETILLIEDNTQVRILTGMLLERNGYRVLIAEDPAVAVAIFEKHSDAIDLLLSDVVMPVMSGLQLYEALLEGKPALKVLFMSGYSPQLYGAEGAEKNYPFIQKPFSGQALLQAVREALCLESAPPENIR